MSGSIWGATPAEWQRLCGMGLQADLLPVVSNPSAPISPRSKMKDLGKTPSKYNSQREAVGIPEWTDLKASDKDIARWQRDNDLGICLQTRQVRAIDIDITDAAMVDSVRELVELLGGVMPVRSRPNSSKCLLAFRLDGVYSKRILRTDKGIIEFLANGQQFIAVGTHPSGARYEWEGGLPFEFPQLSGDEFEVIWSALAGEFATSSVEVRSPSRPLIKRDSSDANDDVLDFLERTGWVKSFDNQGLAHIRCPWEHEHSDGGEGSESATTYFPRGVGGFAQGHFKCLHAHCADRQDGDYLTAIGYVAEDFGIVEAGAGDPKPLPPFTRDTKGRIEPTIGNMRLALERSDATGSEIRYDHFKAAIMLAPHGTTDQWRAFTDHDYVALGERLERLGFKAVPRQLLRDVVSAVAMAQAFDSAQLWLSGIRDVWDGKARIERFWIDYFGVKDSPYARACGRYTWTALAGRVIEPGVKADMVPILVGSQGVGKSTGVAAMSPHADFFTEISFTEKEADRARRLRGKLVGEIGELRGLHTKEMEEIKAWVTRTREEWVPKFFEFTINFDRRLVFIGTTNQDEFLADETGNRRWLPMRSGTVDVARIKADCLQLWAEAAWLFEQSGVDYRDAQSLAVDEHAEYTISDIWDDAIARWLGADADMDRPGAKNSDFPFTVSDVFFNALAMDLARVTKPEQMRMAKILTRLGCVKVQFMREGRNTKGWKQV